MADHQRREPNACFKLACGLAGAVALGALLLTLTLRAGIDGMPLEQALALQVSGVADAVLIGAALALLLVLTWRHLWLATASPVRRTPFSPRHPPLFFPLMLFAWAVALPLLFALGSGMHGEVEARAGAQLKTAHEAARMAAHQMDRRLENGAAALASLAAHPRLRALGPSSCEPLVSDIFRSVPPFVGVDVRDIEGRAVCTAKGRPPLPLDPGYLKRQSTGQPFLYVTGTLADRRAALVQPFRNDEGVIIGSLDLETDIDLLRATSIAGLPDAVTVFLLQRNGADLVGTAEAGIAGARPPRPGRLDGLAAWSAGGWIYGAAALSRADWRIVTAVQAPPPRRAVYDLPWLLPALALSCLIAHFGHRYFARPWRVMAEALARTSGTDARLEVPVIGSDEAAETAAAFNHCAEERETLLARLRRNEEQARRAVYLAADWYWTVDNALRIQNLMFSDRVSPELRQHLGALKGRLLWEIDPQRSGRPEMQQLRNALQDRNPFREFTLALRLPGGATLESLWIGEPVHDRNGAFLGYHGVGRDITQWSIQTHSARRFETALAQASDPVLLVECESSGESNRIVFANRAAALLFDYSEASLIGRPLESLLAVDDVASRDELAGALAHGTPLHRRVKVQRRKGASQTMDMRADQLLDGRERCSFVVIMRDLTADVDRTRQVVEAHEELKHAMRQRSHELEVMAKELESFSYTVSHDLRAPIRVVEGFAHILMEDYGRVLDKMAHDHLQRIISAATRMNNMINALLDLSRLSSQPIVREPLSLSRMAEEVIEELRTQDPARELFVAIAPGIVTEGDRTLLRIVLDNLIGNAWKYTARNAHAEIEFGLRQQGDTAVYYVQDNGAGFDMRFADRLFGVFQRLHSAADFPGTGVGLATVQRIIRRHGGRIWAESEPGHGSTFFFTLWERESGVE